MKKNNIIFLFGYIFKYLILSGFLKEESLNL